MFYTLLVSPLERMGKVVRREFKGWKAKYTHPLLEMRYIW